MKLFITYFKLEFKRMIKNVPPLIAGMLIFASLFVAVALIGENVMRSNDSNFNVIKVGIVGAQDDKYTNLAIDVINDMESLENSCVFEYCTQEEAEKGITDGKYDVIFSMPEDYVKGFMHGENKTVTVRFGQGQTGIVGYVVSKLTEVATNMVISTEKNIYAVQDFFRKYDDDNEREALIGINLRFFQEVMARDNIYSKEVINRTEGLPLTVYYFCDAIVMIFLFLGLVSAKLLSKNDITLYKKMNQKGLGAYGQIMATFLSFLLVFSILYIGVAIGIGLAADTIGLVIADSVGMLIMCSLILIPSCAVIQLVYEIFNEVSHSVLALFVIILVLGFIGGCFYPISFLPDIIKKLADFTVTRAMFNYVSSCIDGISIKWLGIMMFHFLILEVTTVFVRRKRIEA